MELSGCGECKSLKDAKSRVKELSRLYNLVDTLHLIEQQKRNIFLDHGPAINQGLLLLLKD
jgi:hypothetical protein